MLTITHVVEELKTICSSGFYGELTVVIKNGQIDYARTTRVMHKIIRNGEGEKKLDNSEVM